MDTLFFLADFTPIRPDFGLLLWGTIIFALFWYMIGKFSFRPIASALKKRETDIQSALDEARKAKEEMANLNAENQKLLAQARQERAGMLKEAKETSNKMVAEAKGKAKSEAQKIVLNAQREIENQKKQAITEVKNQVGTMAIDIAEKVLRKQLSGDANQKTFVDGLVNEIKLN